MQVRSFLATCALALVPAAASAEVFRCTAPDGAVTYQGIPCPGNSATKVVDVPTIYPAYDVEARERLFQREAALDARLLKRAELDTAERIARENRQAREAPPAEPSVIPVFVAGRVPLLARHIHRNPLRNRPRPL